MPLKRFIDKFKETYLLSLSHFGASHSVILFWLFAYLESATKQTGYTIVPLLVFIDPKGRAKMDIALCKGKKVFDKRQTLKEKEDRREMDRAMKTLNVKR